MRGVFTVFFLQYLLMMTLAVYDIMIGAPITVLDLLYIIPGVFLLLHFCLAFRNDSSVQRKKVTKFILMTSVWTLILNLIHIGWVEGSPETALSANRWKDLSDNEMDDVKHAKMVRMACFYTYAVVFSILNFYFYRVCHAWQKQAADLAYGSYTQKLI